MTKVFTGASMSLDGYISGPAETGFEHLFKWYGNGDVTVPTTHSDMTLQLSAVSAEHWRALVDTTGALVVGRRLFDSMGGWGGNHPLGLPVVVVTHSVPDGWPREDAPFTFVTDGIESAFSQARAVAGERPISIAGGASCGRQAIMAGLVDEIDLQLSPVVLGSGERLLDGLVAGTPRLELERVLEAPGVAHLRYRVLR